jgi:hypothetical protein
LNLVSLQVSFPVHEEGTAGVRPKGPGRRVSHRLGSRPDGSSANVFESLRFEAVPPAAIVGGVGGTGDIVTVGTELRFKLRSAIALSQDDRAQFDGREEV